MNITAGARPAGMVEQISSKDSPKGRLTSEFRAELVRASAILIAATALALLLRPHVAATNLAALYLLAVVAVALRCGRIVSLVSSVMGVAAFDFFCVPPYYTLRVEDYQYLITFAGMLAVALAISTQTVRIREQAFEASRREARAEALYKLSHRLASPTRLFELARTAAECAEELFPASAVILLPENGKITLRRRTSDALPLTRAGEMAAQDVFERGVKRRVSGAGDSWSEAEPLHVPLFVPLKGIRETVGVLVLLPRSTAVGLSSEDESFVDVFAHQTALAMERIQSQNQAEAAQFQMQVEEMRSSLLSGISHDLRTPLASITGAATTLRSQGAKLPPETREELLESIADEAERLERLVENLLDMTRLEHGVELRRDRYPLEEIVGSALQRQEKRLAGRRISVEIPENLPMVFVDDVLLGQVLQNLLENALKYTPPGSEIEVWAAEQEGSVVVEVRDRGPGFPEDDAVRVFEKFYRGKGPAVRGAGLGLAICRAIVRAHQGSIEALNRPGGGGIVRIRLPLGGERA